MIKDELKELNVFVLKMIGQVSINLHYALDALSNYDETKDYHLIDDDQVDKDERKIEETCLHLMLSERLFASDMRLVSGLMCMVEDLERLGDHAEDIMQFSLKIGKNNFVKNEKMERLIKYVINMVESSFKSYLNQDVLLAKKVIDSDDFVDKSYLEMLEQIIKKDETKKIDSSTSIYLTVIVKYLERIADHATNIAEWVIYILTGYYKDSQIV